MKAELSIYNYILPYRVIQRTLPLNNPVSHTLYRDTRLNYVHATRHPERTTCY